MLTLLYFLFFAFYNTIYLFILHVFLQLIKNCWRENVTVHSRVNHYADWHGGCTFILNGISPIAKGDLKWRDALLVTGTVNSNEKPV